MNINRVNIIVLVILGLILVFSGYSAGRIYKTKEIMEEKKNSEMNMNHTAGDMHMGKKTAVFPGWKVPSVNISVATDTMGGYNLNITTSAFWFTPQDTGTDTQPNRGHAHVFVNGVKVLRAYGNYVYMPANLFTTGRNTISVTLMTNDHSFWTNKNGENISASTTVVVK